jgi:hypothetical protein
MFPGALPGVISRNRANNRVLQSANKLHPVLQLGWTPLCEVHCNGCAGPTPCNCAPAATAVKRFVHEGSSLANRSSWLKRARAVTAR